MAFPAQAKFMIIGAGTHGLTSVNHLALARRRGRATPGIERPVRVAPGAGGRRGSGDEGVETT